MKTLLGIPSLMWKLYIAVIFFITATIYYLLILPFLFSEKGKRIAFYLFVSWSWLFRIACLYFVKRELNSPLPKGPYIIIGNHASYLDIFLMYSILPKEPFLFLGKSELLKYPFIGTFFRKMNIPVYRDNPSKAARSFVKASQEAKLGWSLMIFPEGGIPQNNPEMIPFKDGAFKLAKHVDIPIVPITFTNNHILFSDPTQLFGPARPGISKIHIHPYISAEKIDQMSVKELNEYCFKIINAPIKVV